MNVLFDFSCIAMTFVVRGEHYYDVIFYSRYRLKIYKIFDIIF